MEGQHVADSSRDFRYRGIAGPDSIEKEGDKIGGVYQNTQRVSPLNGDEGRQANVDVTKRRTTDHDEKKTHVGQSASWSVLTMIGKGTFGNAVNKIIFGYSLFEPFKVHDVQKAEDMMKFLNQDLNALDEWGNNLMYYAMCSGHRHDVKCNVQLVKMLLVNGVAADGVVDGKNTPFDLIVNWDKADEIINLCDVAELLLQSKDKDGKKYINKEKMNYYLKRAVMRKRAPIVRLLLENGAKIKAEDQEELFDKVFDNLEVEIAKDLIEYCKPDGFKFDEEISRFEIERKELERIIEFTYWSMEKYKICKSEVAKLRGFTNVQVPKTKVRRGYMRTFDYLMNDIGWTYQDAKEKTENGLGKTEEMIRILKNAQKKSE